MSSIRLKLRYHYPSDQYAGGFNINGNWLGCLYRNRVCSLQKNLKAGLAVLGNISVGGAIERSINFADKITMLSENGAKTVVVPMDNLVELTNVPPTVLGNTDVPFIRIIRCLCKKAYCLTDFKYCWGKMIDYR